MKITIFDKYDIFLENKMGECFQCHKNLRRIGIHWSAKMLSDIDIVAPSGMTADDKVCGQCKDELNDEQKKERKNAKNEMKQELNELSTRSAEYKQKWNKNGIIQFKNERIAILKRQIGSQVEFIVAYDDLTKEGYRLMAVDEGMTAQGSGITGGASAYFYFQKMDFVK
jgi:hypothetical protein